MEFRILGPLEVSEGSGPIPLGGPKQRAVLAHLLLRANQVVPAERLIDEVWGEEPPEAARNSLQSYVSHLRKALGPGRIEGRAPGYVLRVEPEEVDALRFERLLREARRGLPTDPVGATTSLQQALALFRGPPLADLAEEPSVQGEIARLDELRLAATEDLLGASLASGRHAEVVAELEALVEGHPLRERLWAHLMLALYRSGRQAEALAAYRRCRTVLAEELGIDPTPELRQLQDQILRQDPALELRGEPLRGYRLLEKVGEGAFGAVWRAEQPQVGREVAVKAINPRFANHPEFIRRFEAEAGLVARLEHPHIVPLYDYWREPDGAYLVTRFLKGGSLRQRLLREGALDAEDGARLAEQIASALSAAHRAGVVHRDVKPENVLLDEEGNAYLSDFGIARDVDAREPAERGPSPAYLAPEQAGGREVTPRSDIYGLGVMLGEALPPGLPAAVEEVLGRATAEDPAARYEDPRAFAAAFREALGAALRVVPAPVGVAVRNPYKGLRPFAEADALDFFGREALTERILARLSEDADGSRFLAVVGPSGNGKSSAVRAGLLPALRKGALPGSSGWFYAEMFPGGHPLEEMEAALLRIAADQPPGLIEQLERDEHGLLRAARRILPSDDSELLLLIDQFEEVFTLTEDEASRAHFLQSLLAAVTDPRSRVRVVVTLRADFYDRPLQYQEFGELLGARTQTVVPLSPEELEQVIAGPAERVGAVPESGLVAEMVAEVADQPGALPLVQYALTELFERRRDSLLTLEAYRRIGGVSGALARRAEELYSAMNEAGREAARQLFLRLVTVAGGTEDTRRLVPRAELSSLEVDQDALEGVIEAYGRHRLLSFDRDPETRGPTVEVAHEALLRQWGRLTGWIEVAREDLLMHRRLASAAAEWEATSREASFLARGRRLDQLESWADATGLALTGQERSYLHASLAQRDAERTAEEARQARERALERRSLTRLRALVGVLTVAALIASGLTVFAFNQRGRVQRESDRAEREARVAQARELAAAAVANLEVDPERSTLLALEAIDATRSVDGTVVPEAEGALHQAILASRIVLTISDFGGSVDWSPDGRLVVSEGIDDTGVVDIRDASTGETVLTFKGHEADINDVAFSPDSSMLATTGDDGLVKVWDPTTGDLLRTLRGHVGAVWGPQFSPDGRLLAAAWADGSVRVFDMSSGEEVRRFRLEPEDRQTTSFSPDGKRLAVAVRERLGAIVFDIASGEELFTLGGHEFEVDDVDWSPDGRWIATPSFDSTIRIWEADTGTLRFTLTGHTGNVVDADWSPDSSRLATVGFDRVGKVWEITENGARDVLSLVAPTGVCCGVAFSPDGTRVITTDGVPAWTAKIWDVGVSGDAEWAVVPSQTAFGPDVTFTPDGVHVVASGDDGLVHVWDAQTGERIRTLDRHGPSDDPTGTSVLAIAVSPDGALIATGSNDETAKVWDAATGREQFSVSGVKGWMGGVAWSPDGALLAAVSDGGVKIVDRTGRELRILPLEVEVDGFFDAGEFSPTGGLLAISFFPFSDLDAEHAFVTIWDLESWSEVRRLPVGAFHLAFDPTGTRIALATPGGQAEVWGVERGEKLRTLSGHTAPLEAVAFSPDGALIATAGQDQTIRLWDAETGDQRLLLRGHKDVVFQVEFSPDGSKLASVSPDGTVRVWAIDLDDLIEIANRNVTRSPTDEECRQYLHLQECPPQP